MSDVLWMIEYEQACEDFAQDGEEEIFESRLKALGFDPDEILDELAAAKGEM